MIDQRQVAREIWFIEIRMPFAPVVFCQSSFGRLMASGLLTGAMNRDRIASASKRSPRSLSLWQCGRISVSTSRCSSEYRGCSEVTGAIIDDHWLSLCIVDQILHLLIMQVRNYSSVSLDLHSPPFFLAGLHSNLLFGF